MKRITYSKYTGEDLGISAEDLMRALSDFFLQSGFQSNYMLFYEMDPHNFEQLKRAIEQALMNGELFPRDRADELRQMLEQMSGEELEQLIQKMVQKLVDEGYLTVDQSQPQNGPGQQGQAGEPKVQITDKS